MERERVWGEYTRVKRRREWDIMGWEEWSLEMEGAAPNGGILNEGDIGDDERQVMEGKRGEWREERGDEGGNDGGEGDGGGDSVVQSHKRKPSSKRKPLRGGRRGKWKGLEEGDREKMASLLRHWIGSGNGGTNQN